MNYFITGATGFIGRYLTQKLINQGGTVFALVREGSEAKLDALRLSIGASPEQLIAIQGNLTSPKLGVSSTDIDNLKGKVDKLFHLAAIYDLKADAQSQKETNLQGTQNTIDFAHAIKAGSFEHVSSIAAAGLYKGLFREDMFEEAKKLDDPYLQTKHESEKLVRNKCKIAWRVYRPAMVVGHSQTGVIDKIDGPYYFFKLIQKMRQALPQWVPTIGLQGGKLNIVPVDYVVDAMCHIAHQDGLDKQCFHLTDTQHHRVGELLNIFAEVAHAPKFTMRVDPGMVNFIPPAIRAGIKNLPPVKRITKQVLKSLDIPEAALQFINYPTRFDNRDTLKALEGSGIECPNLESYAWRLWDYWERNLDPSLFIDRSLSGSTADKVVMVTGATSGIGKAAALKLAEAGAKVLLVARTPEKLTETLEEIEALGGTAQAYSCDVSEEASVNEMIAQVKVDHGHVDILVNNAGRSIRRSIAHSYERFHDYERTMQLNYFGALRLTMGLLPGMQENRFGHVINISSIGVLTNAPKFSAYVSSKAALDAFARCAAAEYSDEGIHFTTINMPLVRTPMIAPTKIYDHVPTISPEEAADMICEAITHRHKRIATRLGVTMQIMHFLAPKTTEIIMNTGFKMFPDSAAALGDKKEADELVEVSTEQVAFSMFMRGIHW